MSYSTIDVNISSEKPVRRSRRIRLKEARKLMHVKTEPTAIVNPPGLSLKHPNEINEKHVHKSSYPTENVVVGTCEVDCEPRYRFNSSSPPNAPRPRNKLTLDNFKDLHTYKVLLETYKKELEEKTRCIETIFDMCCDRNCTVSKIREYITGDTNEFIYVSSPPPKTSFFYNLLGYFA
jgi:hypothetical protein